MRRSANLIHIFSALLCCVVFLMVSSCARVGSGGSSTSAVTPHDSQMTPTVVATAPFQETVPMPPTSVVCPAANTGRAAVVRPLKLGKRQNLVYIYNEVPMDTSTSYGHLRRYDMSSGQVTNIVDSGLHISQAQVSADGQWVLFLSVPDPRGDRLHRALLQLVRVDGQGLQTLYCFPALNGVSSSSIQFQWSVDEKSIVIAVQTQDASLTFTTSQVFVLNVTSGAVRQLLLDGHNGSYSYRVMTWLDDTRFYLLMEGTQAGISLPVTFYLMNARTATVIKPGLKTVLTLPAHLASFSMDSSYNGKKLFTATCLKQTAGMVAVEPSTGGKGQVIVTSDNACAIVVRAISGDRLLLLVEVAGEAAYQVWTMQLDGSGKRVLSTLSSSQIYELNASSQFPWSNVARDGTSYALQQGLSADRQSILIGALKGGNPSTVVTSDNTSSGLDLVGWIVI